MDYATAKVPNYFALFTQLGCKKARECLIKP